MRRFALDALVLDDGFQYWQLARDLDIVLLDARRPFDNGYPAAARPAARAEASSAPRRRSSSSPAPDRLDRRRARSAAAQIRAARAAAPRLFADHRAVGLVPAADLAAAGCFRWTALAASRVFAVSAIAQPESFGETLEPERRAGADSRQAYDDHASYHLDAGRGAAGDVRDTDAGAKLS